MAFKFGSLKISFSEILFQKKPPHTSLVLLFQLRKREEVVCTNEKRVLYGESAKFPWVAWARVGHVGAWVAWVDNLRGSIKFWRGSKKWRAWCG